MQETSFIQWIILAIVQGFTEYLPISSSAHLILMTKIVGFKDQGLVIDVAAHSGSLIAVMWHFKNDLAKLFKGDNWPLFKILAIASIPLAICGYVFADYIENSLRQIPIIIAISSIVFGVLLYLSDKKQKKLSAQIPQQITQNKAMLIGLSQALALIPGTSRSGVTMTAAMALGYNRTTAARFSFLLAIPALLMTTIYGFGKIYSEPSEYNIYGVITVLILSFITSLLSIKVFLTLIEKIPMAVFMWYRIILGVLIIGLLL